MRTFFKFISQIISQLMSFLSFWRKNNNKKEVIAQKKDAEKTEQFLKEIIKDKNVNEINKKFDWKD